MNRLSTSSCFCSLAVIFATDFDTRLKTKGWFLMKSDLDDDGSSQNVSSWTKFCLWVGDRMCWVTQLRTYFCTEMVMSQSFDTTIDFRWLWEERSWRGCVQGEEIFVRPESGWAGEGNDGRRFGNPQPPGQSEATIRPRIWVTANLSAVITNTRNVSTWKVFSEYAGVVQAIKYRARKSTSYSRVPAIRQLQFWIQSPRITDYVCIIYKKVVWSCITVIYPRWRSFCSGDDSTKSSCIHLWM